MGEEDKRWLNQEEGWGGEGEGEGRGDRDRQPGTERKGCGFKEGNETKFVTSCCTQSAEIEMIQWKEMSKLINTRGNKPLM